MHFDDGASPPANIISQWIQLVDETFKSKNKNDSSQPPCIAVHCVAGLGRYGIFKCNTAQA